MNVVTEIADSIEQLVGEHDWSGDNPYVVQMVDSSKREGYVYELMRGENWVTMVERKTSNPRLVRTFQLQKSGDEWEYLDGRLMKYGESSLPELQEAYGRLRIAMKHLNQKPLEDNQRILLPENNS